MSQRQVLLFLMGTAVVMFALAATAVMGGYRLNLTPSEPLGLWRIEELQRPVAIGDLVILCPPTTAVFAEAWRRGYLRRGLCARGLAPLSRLSLHFLDSVSNSPITCSSMAAHFPRGG
jgi:conjugative transfer signal peptidase TraF